MRLRYTLTFAACLTCAALPAAAQDIPPRCAILGQMAVSSWLEMLGELAAPEDSVIDPILSRLDHQTGIYAASGCDVAPLAAAMDCILSDATAETSRALALNCMDQVGLR